MEFEDSRKALFVEPNAYIQRYEKKNGVRESRPQKVVFQEPYDCLPNYYINNGFKKSKCDCVPDSENKSQKELKPEQKRNNTPFGFDLKGLMPMLTMLGQNGGGIGNILSLLKGGDGDVDLTKILSSLMQNKDSLSSIIKLFSGKKNSDKNNSKIDLKSTEFEIKNYTKIQ